MTFNTLSNEKTNNAITFNNTNSSYANYANTKDIKWLNLEPNTTYTSRATVKLTCSQTGGNSAGSMSGCLYLQTNDSFDSGTKYLIVGKTYLVESKQEEEHIVYTTFTTPEDFTGYNYLVTRVMGYGTMTFSDIVLVEGEYDESTFPIRGYEPYKEQTFNIYLDQPLRKVGNVSDYVDLKTGQVVRKINELIIDGNSTMGVYKYPEGAEKLTYYGFSIAEVLDNKYSRLEGLCNMSQYIGAYYNSSYKNTLWIGVNNAYIYCIFNEYYDDTLEDSGLSKFKARLNEVPLKVYYASKNELPNETIESKSFVSYEDYTRIEVLTDIAPSNIEVEYQGYTLD